MRRAASVVCAAALSALPASAIWMHAADVPVDRLLTNLRARLAEAPGEAHRHYQLGRACGLAFALRSGTLLASSRGLLEPEAEGELEALAVQRRHLPVAGGPPRRSAAAELELLATAVRELRLAVDMQEGDARYRLGLAHVLASGAHLASALDSAPLLGAPPLERQGDAAVAEASALVQRLALADPESPEAFTALALLAREDRLGYLDARRADAHAQQQAAVARALTTVWIRRALAEYDAAFERALPEETQLEWASSRGDRELGVHCLVAHEAGRAALELARLPELAGQLAPSRIEAMELAVAHLERLPAPSFITPLVLRFDGAANLASHVAPERAVRFDLDGDGRAERRTWVRPDTGLLVWDPQCRGEITSGRQLFGDATWWMFFRDGYEALDALDDDRDGWIAGSELAGLALWRDADSDAVSDPGEVEDVACLGVVALATRPDTLEGIAPGAARGAWLADGRCLPTWDWVAEPVPEPSAGRARIPRASLPTP